VRVSAGGSLGLPTGSVPVIRADSSKDLAVLGRAFHLTCRPGAGTGLAHRLA